MAKKSEEPEVKVPTATIMLDRELLSRKLKLVCSVINEKAIIPITQESLVTVKKDSIHFRATNTGVSIETQMEIFFPGEPFEFVCDVLLIQKTILLLRAEEVILEVSAESVQIKTAKTRNKYVIPIIYKAKDFPKSNSDWDDQYMEIEGSIFCDAIKATASIVDPNDAQLQFSGVNIRFDGKSIFFESARQMQMIQCEYKLLDEIKLTGNALVPKSILNVIDGYSNSQKIKIYIDKGNRNLKIYDGISTSELRLIDIAAVDITRIFQNADAENFMVVNKNEIVDAFKRIMNFTISKIDPHVKFDMTENSFVRISFKDHQFKKEAEEFIDVSSKSPLMNFKSGLNHKMFLNSMGFFNDENIAIHQLAKEKPFYIRNADEGLLKIKWAISATILQKEE